MSNHESVLRPLRNPDSGHDIHRLLGPRSPSPVVGTAKEIRVGACVYFPANLAKDYGSDGVDVVAVSTLEKCAAVSDWDGDMQTAVRDGEGCKITPGVKRNEIRRLSKGAR